MTTPPERITVECPGCGERYEDWHRRSINLSLGEPWTADELREASTATCPRCSTVVEVDTLVIENGIWKFGGPADHPDDAAQRPAFLMLRDGTQASLEGVTVEEAAHLVDDALKLGLPLGGKIDPLDVVAIGYAVDEETSEEPRQAEAELEPREPLDLDSNTAGQDWIKRPRPEGDER